MGGEPGTPEGAADFVVDGGSGSPDNGAKIAGESEEERSERIHDEGTLGLEPAFGHRVEDADEARTDAIHDARTLRPDGDASGRELDRDIAQKAANEVNIDRTIQSGYEKDQRTDKAAEIGEAAGRKEQAVIETHTDADKIIDGIRKSGDSGLVEFVDPEILDKVDSIIGSSKTPTTIMSHNSNGESYMGSDEFWAIYDTKLPGVKKIANFRAMTRHHVDLDYLRNYFSDANINNKNSRTQYLTDEKLDNLTADFSPM